MAGTILICRDCRYFWYAATARQKIEAERSGTKLKERCPECGSTKYRTDNSEYQ